MSTLAVAFTEIALFDVAPPAPLALAPEPAQVEPIDVDTYAAVCRAINESAPQHKGLVHISYVRPHLPAGLHPQGVGSAFGALRLAWFLCPTNLAPIANGDTKSGNRHKLTRPWRLTRPIPIEVSA